MNKAELLQEISVKAGLKAKEAEALLEAFIATTEETLAKGDKVSITGFGTFAVTERAARKGRNPQTGQTIDIPASKTPRFTAGKSFKDAVK
ncbi:HU family DNA-binding protein [Deferrisoma camini]|uniref:HU family DNA-binding protein n=1 Tax=Deferrisoma camini TaxID=1035120 RepID=UPI00046CEEE7|nr:HU family DNA-binding protein [Deferrisoma camini]